MANPDDALSTTVFYNPGWIAFNGGFIHSNNVLFYFAESPFFDRTSANQSIITQSAGIPERVQQFLSTRKRFEHQLSLTVGLQYVVAHDPLESKTQVKGPNGLEPSDLWVIRKQYRHSADGRNEDLTVQGYYYIMNQTIYQAPSVGSILTYRLLNTSKAMNDIFSKASKLPLFSASHGHTYHPPVVKRAETTVTATGQGKEDTPMPDAQATTSEKTTAAPTIRAATIDPNVRTLNDALNMTMRYGKEYMDDMPLVGEPGNFRFARTKEITTGEGQSFSTVKTQSAISKVGTPVPSSRRPSPPPAIQTDVAPAPSKKSAKSPGNGDPMKPKRRKSKAANLLTPE